MQNIINHIVLVLDASSSMESVSDQLVKVADNQIKYLATRSQELDQETRITVYTFATEGYSRSKIDCLIYDKDVLRVPSIATLYQANGMTPLIDGTLMALGDLAATPEKYGEHSFLIYVLTDGMENASRGSAADLSRIINGLPDNWTLATFVPNQTGVFEAKKFGFPKENIAVWDATTAAGVAEAGRRIRETTENFMVSRSRGVRGMKNIFAVDNVSINEVDSKLQALHYGQFRLYDVDRKQRIDEFIEDMTGRAYELGEGFYELSKTEIIQPQKKVAILGKKGLYVGADARQLLGLPNEHVKVGPNHNPDYKVFVQSTSNNRNLMPDTKLLVLSRNV